MLGKTAGWANRLPGLFAICDQGVVSLTNFATGVIIGRMCGRAELGIYALAWTLMTQATEFSATITATPYTVFSPQLSRNQRKLYLGSVLTHQLLLSMIFALVIAAGAALGLWRGLLSYSLTSVITTTACAIPFIGLREFVRRVSFAELKVSLAFLVDGIACLAQAGGVLLLLHFSALTASRTYTLLGISSALVAGGWLFLHWGAFRVDARLCGEDLKRNWCFSKWVLGSSLLFTFVTYLYPWLLAAFHGTSVTGTWAACSAIVALGNPLSLGLSNHVGPQIHNVYAKSGPAAMQRCVYRSSLLFAMLLLPVLLLLVGGGERIVAGVYGKEYAGSSGVVILLALNMFISALMYPFSRGFFSLDRAKVDTLINIVAFILLLAVGIAAVKSHSAFGAAATLLASSAVAAVIRIGAFAREIRRRAPEVRPHARSLAIESID
jgi:O-antigen/teichoic acid export membrane protein